MTLRALIHKTLRDDTTLRNLLSKTSTPYGVYQNYPPEDVEFPIVTHREGFCDSGLVRPKNIVIESWGSDRNNIAERIYDLLHDKTSQDISNFCLLKIRFQQSDGEMYDQNFGTWFRKDVYRCIVAKE